MLIFFAYVQQSKIREVIRDIGFHDARKFDIPVVFDFTKNLVNKCRPMSTVTGWQCNKGKKTVCYEEIIIFLKLCSLIYL